MMVTYSIWSLLQLETLEEVYNRALTDFQDEIAQGRGGSRPPLFSVFYTPVEFVWRADLTWGGLNYSMLSVVFAELKRLHTDPASSAIYRKMIYYDILEQRGAQRFGLGGGQVESLQAISKRQSVNPLHTNYRYQIPSTPYEFLVTASSGPGMPNIPLQEVYSLVILALEDGIAQGRGAAKPVDFTFQRPPVTLTWDRSAEETGLNHTDLLKAFKALESIHMNRETPWQYRKISYNIVGPNAEQGLVAMGGGLVEDLRETGPSKVSVQNSKRNLVERVKPLPSYVCQLPDTPYILEIRAVAPNVRPQLPLDPLIGIYNMALQSFIHEMIDGHGGDVPAVVDIERRPISLDWRRHDPPGLNYSMLLRVYQLMRVIQTNEATPFRGGYRMNLFVRVVTVHDEVVGIGKVVESAR